MARIILVRHGETEWNRLLKYQGQSDIDLNEVGIEQARKIRDRLAGEKIDHVYCSDLKRAVTTAEIIASNGNVPELIKKVPLLREMHFGDFEGLNFEEMKTRFPDMVTERQMWRNRKADVCAPNGESLSQVADRVKEFLKELECLGPDETALIVAHGGSLQILMCLLLGISPDHWWQIRMSNASVTIMETHEHGAAITLFNDVCHLE